MINKPLIYKDLVFKDFTNHRKKTNRVVVFSCRLSPTFFNIGNTDDTFQQSGKQDTFRHILKSSASMYRPRQIYLNVHNFLGLQFYLHARSSTQIGDSQNQSGHWIKRQLETLLFVLYYLDRFCGFYFFIVFPLEVFAMKLLQSECCLNI